MAATPKTAVSPTRSEDYPEWYQQVIRAAELAESSPVRGCMVIRPWGYALWENIRYGLDREFRKVGVRNAYFPLFIPVSFLEREAEHVEGFAKECAVVTHSRLEAGPDGRLVPTGELEEPLVVRPTSETIIGEVYAKWVQSYRDLPLLINQWANVVRWEMRTRMFLRTTEFLWQEGHTVHATEEEARSFAEQILNLYGDFAEEVLALPVWRGRKTSGDRFPGAVDTLAIESLMQDGKALQAGTSHFLGQNFSRASNIRFLGQDGQESYGWTTSWGVSTRLIGGMIMAHGDDDGFVCPPRIAPAHVAILSVTPKEESRADILDYCRRLSAELTDLNYRGESIRVELDDRDIRGGDKAWSWIKKGIPIRLEIGPRELSSDSVFVGRRDQPAKERKAMPREQFLSEILETLDQIHQTIFERARAFQESQTFHVASRDEFYHHFAEEGSGFVLAHYHDDPAVEDQLQRDLKVTARCIPLQQESPGTCIFSGRKSAPLTLFAKAY